MLLQLVAEDDRVAEDDDRHVGRCAGRARLHLPVAVDGAMDLGDDGTVEAAEDEVVGISAAGKGEDSDDEGEDSYAHGDGDPSMWRPVKPVAPGSGDR